MILATSRRVLFVLALVCGIAACGGGRKGSADAATANPTDAATTVAGTGGATMGRGTGGTASGGATAMDAASGGIGSGGLATGGSGLGGAGIANGGTGGAGTGGAGAAGTGDAGTGGVGGTGAGGAGTGGAGTVRTGIGGSGTGGGYGGSGRGGAGGTPSGALLVLDGSRMDFGFVAPATTSVAAFTLTNVGASTSGVPSISIQYQRNPTGWLLVTGCTAALPANASCVLTISVTPPAIGLFEAFVHVSADPGTQGTGSSGLPIYVVGWGIGFGISSPTSVDFGDLAPGEVAKHSFTVTATTALSDLKVWTAGDEVSIDAAATTCTTALAQGASCVVAVQFVAATLGWRQGMVGVKAGGDLGQVANVELTANVTSASDLAVEPKTPPSYTCVFEQTSPPVVFAVTNLGDAASGTIAVSIVGDSARDFAVSQTDCAILAAHASCTFGVVCKPAMSASAATRHAIVSVTDGKTQVSIPLSGEVSFKP